MEREVKVVRVAKGGPASDAPERRQRRVQVITKSGGSCDVVCEPACCGEGTDCCGIGGVCLCGCRAPEISEVEEEGHTVITIRVPKVVREGGEDDALVRAAGVSEAVDSLGSEMAAVVRRARAQGSSWTDIGAALGISKQAAWERFSGEE